MKLMKTIIAILLMLLLLSPAAFAQLTWYKEGINGVALAWDNGTTQKTVISGEKAIFTTGYFISERLSNDANLVAGPVELTVEVVERATGNSVAKVVDQQKIETKKPYTNQQVTIDTTNYKAAEYVVVVKLQEYGSSTEIQNNLVSGTPRPLYLTVVESGNPSTPSNPNANPTLKDAEFATEHVTEGDEVLFYITANDATHIVARDLPNGATFNPTTGEFRWKTNFQTIVHPEQAIAYSVDFSAIRNKNDLANTVLSSPWKTKIIVVNDKNRYPHFEENVRDITVTEGESAQMSFVAKDLDQEDILQVKTYTKKCGPVFCAQIPLALPNTPQEAITFLGVDNYKGTYFIAPPKGFVTSGSEKSIDVFVEVADGYGGVREDSFTVTVKKAGSTNPPPPTQNEKPTLTTPVTGLLYSMKEGEQKSLTIKAQDKEDGTQVSFRAYPECTFSFLCQAYPSLGVVGVDPITFVDNGDGTASFGFTPDYTYVQHERKLSLVNTLANTILGAPLTPSLAPATPTLTVPLQKTQNIVVEVTDKQGAVTKETFQLAVLDVNRKARFDPTSATMQATVGQEFTLTLPGTDDDKEDVAFLGYTMMGAPQGATLVGNTFKFTPTAVGSTALEFTVDDGFTQGQLNTFILNIDAVAAPVVNNQAPQFNLPSNITGIVGDTLELDYTAVDPEGDVLRYDEPQANVALNAQIDRTNQVYRWTATQAGTYSITFTVRDYNAQGNIEHTVQHTVDVEITDPVVQNGAPVILSQPARTAKTGEEYQYDIIAIDPENDVLTYTLRKGPADMFVDVEFGYVRWTPQAEKSENIILEVSDGVNVVRQHYTIAVGSDERNLQLMSVRVAPEVARPGETIMVGISLENNGDISYDQLRVTAMIYDLGLRRQVGEFDLSVGEHKGKIVPIQLPFDIMPGTYDLRVRAEDDFFHEVAHRQVIVE